MNTKLNDAIANYFSNTEAINEDTQITAKNTSFFAGGEIEKNYTVKELVAFMSNQPAQVVDSAIAVLSQLTETNDSRYDVVLPPSWHLVPKRLIPKVSVSLYTR